MEDSSITTADASLQLVVGLGNPGEDYAGTRHNTGFDVVDMLMKNAETVEKLEWQPELGELFRVSLGIELPSLLVLKPMTFMNLSGQAVLPTMEWSGITPRGLLVVSDDLDMPLGRLRVRMRGSSGGHRGIASIATNLGTEDFPRLRVGVGRPQSGKSGVVDYVLAGWTSDEVALFERVCAEACRLIRKFAENGVESISLTLKEDSSDKINAKDEGDPEIEVLRSSSNPRPPEG